MDMNILKWSNFCRNPQDNMCKDIHCNTVYISLQKEKPKNTSVREKIPYGMYAHIRNQYRETMKNWVDCMVTWKMSNILIQC